MKEVNKKLSEKDIEKIEKEYIQEMERESILMKADEVKEETFAFDIDGQVELKNEIADLVLEQIDDPEAKYNLYYNVIERLLKKYLPKGEEHKQAREWIREEKNTFLTRGHGKDEKGIRGADGRMAYIPDINEIVNIITEWITSKGSLFELYTKLRDLNISKGYGEPRI